MYLTTNYHRTFSSYIKWQHVTEPGLDKKVPLLQLYWVYNAEDNKIVRILKLCTDITPIVQLLLKFY